MGWGWGREGIGVFGCLLLYGIRCSFHQLCRTMQVHHASSCMRSRRQQVPPQAEGIPRQPAGIPAALLHTFLSCPSHRTLCYTAAACCTPYGNPLSAGCRCAGCGVKREPCHASRTPPHTRA